MTDTDPDTTKDIVDPLDNVDLEPGTKFNDEKTDRAGTNIALETKVTPENMTESKNHSQADDSKDNLAGTNIVLETKGTPENMAESKNYSQADDSKDNLAGTNIVLETKLTEYMAESKNHRQAVDSKDNLAGDVEGKETTDTTNWRQRTITWMNEKKPVVKEGLRKTKLNLGEKWGVVSEFTKQEAQLIGSQVKWAYYCRNNERTDESKFVDTFYLVNDWKVSLKGQKKALQKLIKYQKEFESNQEHLIAALRQIPDSSECGNSSTRLGTMIEQKKRNLVSTINLEKILSIPNY